jgi:hypothetical protein
MYGDNTWLKLFPNMFARADRTCLRALIGQAASSSRLVISVPLLHIVGQCSDTGS